MNRFFPVGSREFITISDTLRPTSTSFRYSKSSIQDHYGLEDVKERILEHIAVNFLQDNCA